MSPPKQQRQKLVSVLFSYRKCTNVVVQFRVEPEGDRMSRVIQLANHYRTTNILMILN